VRVVSFGEEEGVSAELCGGTHVDSTAEIGGFRIVSEGSVGANARRIEVVTGRAAQELVEERLAALEEVADLVGVKAADVVRGVEHMVEQNQALQRELNQLRQKLARQESEALLANAVAVDGFAVLAAQVNAGDVDTLRQMTDFFRDKLGSSVVAVGAVINDKPMIVAAVTDDLVARGMHAGNLVGAAPSSWAAAAAGAPRWRKPAARKAISSARR
jgi:alanyl-tRNA synthetase